MKRFTATEKWAKTWFQDLPPKLKCLWLFICDNADAAGVWEPNFRLASFQIGETVSAPDMAAFGDRVKALGSGKFHIVEFVNFQYGHLSEACKAHIPVFRALEKHSLCIAYPKAPQSLKETEEEKEARESAERGKLTEAAVAVVEAWNKQEKLPRVILPLSSERAKKLSTRLRDPLFKARGIEAVERIGKSKFCWGENEKGWRATFDFLLQPDTAAKALEGKYDTLINGLSASMAPKNHDAELWHVFLKESGLAYDAELKFAPDYQKDDFRAWKKKQPVTPA